MLEKAARAFFDGRPTSEPQEYPQELDALLLKNPGEVRGLVWEIYRRSLRHDEAREDFENSRVRSGKHESPYKVREVGEKPEGGWPLFWAMMVFIGLILVGLAYIWKKGGLDLRPTRQKRSLGA